MDGYNVLGMDLREIGWGSVDWIQLAKDRDRWLAVVNTVMNLQVLAPRSYLVRWTCIKRDVRWREYYAVEVGNWLRVLF
jgi:hypothetical protein